MYPSIDRIPISGQTRVAHSIGCDKKSTSQTVYRQAQALVEATETSADDTLMLFISPRSSPNLNSSHQVVLPATKGVFLRTTKRKVKKFQIFSNKN